MNSLREKLITLFVVTFILIGMFADNSFVGVGLTFLFAAPFLYT